MQDDLIEQVESPGTARAEEPGGVSGLGLFASRESISGLLMAAGMLVMVFLLIRVQKRRWQRGRTHAVDLPRPRISGDPATDRLENALADANELTRHLVSALDARAARIEALLEDADARIAALEAGRDTDDRANGPARYEALDSLAEAGHSPVEIARRLEMQPGEVELMLRLRRG